MYLENENTIKHNVIQLNESQQKRCMLTQNNWHFNIDEPRESAQNLVPPQHLKHLVHFDNISLFNLMGNKEGVKTIE